MPRPRKSKIFALTSAVWLAAAPAFAEDISDDVESKSRDCILVSSINGFNAIDNKHLTVSVGASKTYLVSLVNTCHDLRWTEDIAYDATLSWSCTNTHDKIIVEGRSCFIDTIEQVESHAAAKAMVQGGGEESEDDEDGDTE